MSEPFLAEIRIFGFNFAPRGWALCNGQLMPISQNTALFSLLGTSFGGNGTSTFGLPNLQATAAIGVGQGQGLSQYVVGETGGSQTVTLLNSEMPAHTHVPNCGDFVGNQTTPANYIWAKPHVGHIPDAAYNTTANSIMNPQIISAAGGSQPHNNMPPYLTVNFCIALSGIYPQRN